MTPRRQQVSQPPVVVDVASAYELLNSVAVVLDAESADTYDVGADWFDAVRARAGDDLLDRMRAATLGDHDTLIHLMPLAYDTPAPRDAAAFLAQLRQTDPDELKLHLVQYYSRDTRRMTPPAVIRAAVAGDQSARDEFLRTSHADWEPWTGYLRAVLDADGRHLKRDLVDALTEWNQRVWGPESLTIMPILERDAEAKRALMGELPMERFIESATNGVEFAPRPGIARVIMVPSFVTRPVVSYVDFGDALLIIYPVADESVSAFTDAPPLRLVRLSKALGDERRLRILRNLAEGEKTLMELAEHFGLAKTTMHHHMIILRSAGLITASVGSKRYRLRHEALPDVGALLSGYLGAATGPSASESPAPSRRRRVAGAR